MHRFVAVERGAVSYPRYDIQRTRPVFTSRQQLLAYQDALGLAARVDTALEVSTRLLDPFLHAICANTHINTQMRTHEHEKLRVQHTRMVCGQVRGVQVTAGSNLS